MAEPQRDYRPDPNLRHYPGDKARQGEIILKTPMQRAIFVAGLIALVLAVLILSAIGFSR